MGSRRGVQPDGTIDLHGKKYLTVARRVAEFRLTHTIDDGWCIATKPEHIDDQGVLFRAAIIDPNGIEVAVGFAEEKRTAKGIGATSALENAETSAIGRALAAAGWPGTEVELPQEMVEAEERKRQAEEAAEHARQWRAEVETFRARLKTIDLTLEQVHGYVAHKQWPPLGQMSPGRRENMFTWLKMQDGAEVVRAWHREQADTRQEDAAPPPEKEE